MKDQFLNEPNNQSPAKNAHEHLEFMHLYGSLRLYMTPLKASHRLHLYQNKPRSNTQTSIVGLV